MAPSPGLAHDVRNPTSGVIVECDFAATKAAELQSRRRFIVTLWHSRQVPPQQKPRDKTAGRDYGTTIEPRKCALCCGGVNLGALTSMRCAEILVRESHKCFFILTKQPLGCYGLVQASTEAGVLFRAHPTSASSKNEREDASCMRGTE